MLVPESAVFDMVQSFNNSVIITEDSSDTLLSTFHRGFTWCIKNSDKL